MLEVLIKTVTSASMPVSAFFVGKNILNNNERFLKLRNIICIIVLSIVTFLLYDIEYQVAITLLNFSAMVIGYKIMFKRDFLNSFILATVLMLFTFISETILGFIILPFFSTNLIRNFGFPMLLGNLVIGGTTIILSKINFFKRIISNVLSKLEKYAQIQSLILCLVWIGITSILCYFIFNSLTDSVGFLIGSCIQFCFIIFIINFFRDKSKYVSLNEKFDTVYNYLDDMEKYVNAERLNIHEYKNQLSVIRSMTKNKKITDYIDSIIKDTKVDVEWASDLSNLPSGGFKGLIYYKFMQANSKNITVSIEISSKCRTYFENLSVENIKELSRLLGIYLDNAIEAAEHSNKKIVCLEIYKTKCINIAVSNSINEQIDINRLNEKGYTSKGKGRGNGLYLAKKIIDKNSNIEIESKLINSYFVQKIKLK